MQGNTPPKNVKALEAALASARATVVSLEAALADPIDRSGDMLGERQTMAQYNVARDGLLRAADRGELELCRGPRNAILVERQEIERWLKSRPHRPRPKSCAAPANTLEEWDQQVETELRALGGRE